MRRRTSIDRNAPIVRLLLVLLAIIAAIILFGVLAAPDADAGSNWAAGSLWA